MEKKNDEKKLPIQPNPDPSSKQNLSDFINH